MIKRYSFTEATPLLDFIECHREQIIGKTLKGFYASGCFVGTYDEPLVFEFEEFVLILNYYFYSDMELYVVDPETFHADETLNFLYRDIPSSRNVRHYLTRKEFPYAGNRVEEILIERFSEEFEVEPSSGRTRPDGGDYFKMITVRMDDGDRFFICPLDAMCDGYVEIWG